LAVPLLLWEEVLELQVLGLPEVWLLEVHLHSLVEVEVPIPLLKVAKASVLHLVAAADLCTPMTVGLKAREVAREPLPMVLLEFTEPPGLEGQDLLLTSLARGWFTAWVETAVNGLQEVHSLLPPKEECSEDTTRLESQPQPTLVVVEVVREQN
jgi:hypothetical protein